MRLAAALCVAASCAAAEAPPVCSFDPAIWACAPATLVDAEGVLRPGDHAWYLDPTKRYDHGVFGEAVEWGALTYLRQGSAEHGPLAMATLTLPATRVFEDIAPRMADLDGDGSAEIVVVETDLALGASLAVYAYDGEGLVKIAATSFIGQTHRWLAPAGIADFDGDGWIEIAYVDRPHLAKELVFLRYEGGKLTEIARVAGLTNHHYGQKEIFGGLRRCNGHDSLVVASADGTRAVEVDLRGGVPVLTDRGPISVLAASMRCG